MNKEIQKNYASPRWTNEIADCSMPMTFDTYSKCAYNCIYCFAYFQKSHTLNGYKAGDVRCVNPDRVKKLFESARANDEKAVNKTERQFFPYIRARKIMQWGGMADQFDEYERRHGITLELLRYFDKIDYPLSLSTKATWWTKDERYMELFRRHGHNWHVKISIITADDEKARRMEKGVDSSTERLAAIKRLTDAGVHVTLRLRPYIIGLSDDWKELIAKAKEAGADSVTTEFFCMESRADDNLKKRYAEMSKIVGYDIHTFYMKNSRQSGYKRLSRAIKKPIVKAMSEYCHDLGLRFHSSDAHCRDYNDACNCCGVPPEFNSHKGHIGNAVIIAREKGEVHWSDISEEVEQMFGFLWQTAAAYNTGTNHARAVRMRMSMADYLHNNWNNPNNPSSPAKAYGGILAPDRKDEKGDIVYKYKGARDDEKENGTTKDRDR